MFNSFIDRANELKKEIIDIRRRFHKNPELGFEEVCTGDYIAGYLKSLGIEVIRNVARTGVIGILHGNLPGNTIAVRADMDALPVQEETNFCYKSKVDGKMHACGHDGHMAIVLGAAKLLSENKEKLRGIVKFIFQPAEEGIGGAEPMIEEGTLKDPDVDMVLGLHITPDVEKGKIQVRKGVMLSSMDMFEINIRGKGGHGSTPHLTIDPIITGVQIVNALQTIVSRRVNPLEPVVVSVCQFIAGNKFNIIPDTAYISGTIRSFDEEIKDFMLGQIESISKGICEAADAEYRVNITKQFPVTVNHPNMFEDFVAVCSNALDEYHVEIAERPTTFSDDFAFFSQEVPGLYFKLGTYNKEKDCVYPLHSPKYSIDEDILPAGVAVIAYYCLNRNIK